jgi:hypothetical protein
MEGWELFSTSTLGIATNAADPARYVFYLRKKKP